MFTTPVDFRLLCRRGNFSSNTSGVLPSYMQANLVILPSEIAKDFLDLCARNPVPCPLLATTKCSFNELDNDSLIAPSKQGFDIRTDFPRYCIFERGKLKAEVNDCRKQWRYDHVGFLLGCSYSFEGALINAGLTPKNIIRHQNVSMYKTTKHLDAVRRITADYIITHGEPIDWGFDGADRLGITNLSKPEYGDAIDIEDDEIPVFWGCGVTPRLAVEIVGHQISGPVITHSPGCMLVLDVTYEQFSNMKLR